MTDITPEALEALSKKATQGVWDIASYYTGTGPDENCHGLVEVEDFPIGIIDEEGATAESLSPNLEFIVALVNAYRTGQLIPAPSVETLARTLCLELGRMGDTEAVERNRVEADWPRYVRIATTAISAMQVKP